MAAPSPVPAPLRTPTIVTGIRDPSQLVSQRIVPDVADKIAFVRPSANPLCLILMGVKKLNMRPATQRQFDWLEKDPLPDTTRVVGAQTAGDATIDVSAGTGTYAKQFDMWLNTITGELIYLSTAPATDTFGTGAVRGFGGTTAAAMEDGQILLKVANAFEDGVGKGALKSVREARLFNYCQIVRNAWGFTRREATMKLYGGSDVDSEEQAQSIEHMVQLEKMAWFGGRSLTTGVNNREVTSTNGILSFLTTNVWNLAFADVPTENQVVTAVEQAMLYGKNGNVGGGGDKLLFASRNWMTFFDRMAREKVRYVDMGELLGRGRIGLTVGEFHTVHGRIVLISHPLFPPDLAVVVDPAHIWMRYHQGGNGFPDGKTRIRREIQLPDEDSVINEYLSDVGIQVELEMAHMVWRGLPSLG